LIKSKQYEVYSPRRQTQAAYSTIQCKIIKAKESKSKTTKARK